MFKVGPGQQEAKQYQMMEQIVTTIGKARARETRMSKELPLL
jgi:hypothetical protein